MKHNLKKIYLIIIFSAVMFSCNDDFMERYPLDQVSSETFWNTENDLISYNNSLYALALDDNNVPIMMGRTRNTSSYPGTSDISFLDFYSDDYTTHIVRYAEYTRVRHGKHVVPTEGTFNGWLGWNFIYRCNFGLANYDRAEVAQDIKNKYIAEARLFRGWFFADKVTKFGDIPYFENVLNIDSEELFAERMPREEAMEYILADLEFASKFLPDDWGDGNAPGRLNRWCALLVKSRVCLFEGTWRRYHGGTNPDRWLQIAADAAREIMDKGPYRLHSTGNPDHDYNFASSWYDGTTYHKVYDFDGNTEVMYWERFIENLNENYHSYFHRAFTGASKSFVEDYLCTDGLPITLSPLYQGDATYEAIFENRDPRLRQTILHPDDRTYYQYGNQNDFYTPRLPGVTANVGTAGTTMTGYSVIKEYDGRLSTGNRCVNPPMILRFAEALLNYAEAMAELGTITQADLDMSINKLRDRVNMVHLDMTKPIPMDPRYANDGISSLILEIRRERRIELFMEGHRYNDLLRWKQGKKLENPLMGVRWDDHYRQEYDPQNKCTSLTTDDPVTGIPYIHPFKNSEYDNPVFDEGKHYLWPIPLNVLSINPNLKQNPGW